MRRNKTDNGQKPAQVPDSSVRRVCALDLGSKTFKAIIGEMPGGDVATRLLTKRTLQLGAEVAANKGYVGPAKLAEVRQALSELKEICIQEGGEVILPVATRAVRRAANREAFLDTAREVGVAVQVADGKREGELAYLAVTGGVEHKLVCDFGSQSMQLAWRTLPAIESHSLNVGYERAHADFFRNAQSFAEAHNSYSQFLREHLPPIPSGLDELICLAMNTMASFVTGRPKTEITNKALHRSTLRAKLADLDSMSAADAVKLESATPKLDKIYPGIVLLDHLLEQAGLDEAIIAEAEMAAGLIVEYFLSSDRT